MRDVYPMKAIAYLGSYQDMDLTPFATSLTKAAIRAQLDRPIASYRYAEIAYLLLNPSAPIPPTAFPVSEIGPEDHDILDGFARELVRRFAATVDVLAAMLRSVARPPFPPVTRERALDLIRHARNRSEVARRGALRVSERERAPKELRRAVELVIEAMEVVHGQPDAIAPAVTYLRGLVAQRYPRLHGRTWPDAARA